MSDRRLQGAREPEARVVWLLALAKEESDPTARFRFLVFATYAARAVVEHLFEAADNQVLRGVTRKVLKKQFRARIPFYFLVERIRIHDFHRYGLLPPHPDPNITELALLGPVSVTVTRGTGSVMVSEQGPSITGDEDQEEVIEQQRPLTVQDGEFYDEASQRFLPLEYILEEYQRALPAILAELAALPPGKS